jgi:hypothetical protein
VNKIKQEGRSVEEYYNELQNIWLEIDFRRPNPIIYAIDIENFENYSRISSLFFFGWT